MFSELKRFTNFNVRKRINLLHIILEHNQNCHMFRKRLAIKLCNALTLIVECRDLDTDLIAWQLVVPFFSHSVERNVGLILYSHRALDIVHDGR